MLYKEMNMIHKASYYEGFAYPAQRLSAYIRVQHTFIISFKNGKLIRHKPGDPASFTQWLSAHRIRCVIKEQAAIPYAMAG